jgi:RNA polymerase sigma-70 factor (ECF subfamily)
MGEFALIENNSCRTNESGPHSIGDQQATSAYSDRDMLWREYVRRIAAQDQAGLAALYQETGAIVYGLVMRVLGSPADVEEVTNDVYAQVWQSAAAYQEVRGSVLTWVAMMARTRAIDRLRSGALRARAEQPLALADLRAGGSENASVSRLDGQRVRNAFRSLPPEQREVVTLAYFSGMSHSEIAGNLRIPLGTVKTRIRLGISKLREYLRCAA